MTTKKISATVQLAPKLAALLSPPLGTYRYRCAYGGRGGGKSFSFALVALIFGMQKYLRVMCVRQFKVSVAKSFYAELQAAIYTFPWLTAFYTLKETSIVGKNGTTFHFGGLERNLPSIKGLTKYNLWILEEAEDISEAAWQILPQTVREPGSELWVIYNPGQENSPTDLRMRKNPPSNSAVVEIQYYDNPYFPDVLEQERRRDKKLYDQATYDWIWLGQYFEMAEAQIFRNKYIIDTFTPAWDWDGPFQGLDFGFSIDPTAAVRIWRKDYELFIERECSRVHLELDDTARFLIDEIPRFEKYEIIADSARPESISYLSRKGLPNIKAARKGPNSVREGISKLKAHKNIIIHERCQECIYEFKHYKYKIDKHTQKVTADIIDANNHHIDGSRYAIEDLESHFNYGLLV